MADHVLALCGVASVRTWSHAGDIARRPGLACRESPGKGHIGDDVLGDDVVLRVNRRRAGHQRLERQPAV